MRRVKLNLSKFGMGDSLTGLKMLGRGRHRVSSTVDVKSCFQEDTNMPTDTTKRSSHEMTATIR